MPKLRDRHGQLLPLSSDPGHRVTANWMGSEVLTLEDLLRPRLRAVCIGINPSNVSVAAGHYYQGVLGQRFFARLRGVGLIPEAAKGLEDDVAFKANLGFTDLIKRPTARASELRKHEFEHGRGPLVKKMKCYKPGLVIFTYKDAAESVFGEFHLNGFAPGLRLGGAPCFVMPGPMESNKTALPTLAKLADFLNR